MIVIYAILGIEKSDDGNFFCEVPIYSEEKIFPGSRFVERDATQEGAIEKMYKRLKKKFGWWRKVELNIEPPQYVD